MLGRHSQGSDSGIVARARSWPEAADQLSLLAYDGSVSASVAAWVAANLPNPIYLSPIGRILAAYQCLPTRYVADGVDDFWQYVWWTLSAETGDCEDSSTAEVAILGYLGIDARVAVIPGHAAVLIPVVRDGWGRRFVDGWQLPADWATFEHQGQTWLGLETTLTVRRLPGEGTQKLRAAASASRLWIGPPLQNIRLLLTLRALNNAATRFSPTRAGRLRRRGF